MALTDDVRTPSRPGLRSAALTVLIIHTRALPQLPQGPGTCLPGGPCESHTEFGVYVHRPLLSPEVVGGPGLLVLERPTWGMWPPVCPVTCSCVPSGSRTAWADAQICSQVDSGTPSGVRAVALPSEGPRSLATRLSVSVSTAGVCAAPADCREGRGREFCASFSRCYL